MDASNYDPSRADPQPIEGDVASFTAGAAPAPLTGNTAEAVAFLVDALHSGLVQVVAIHPETGDCQGATFDLTTERDKLTAWIEARQGRFNLYYVLNEPVPVDHQTGRHGRTTGDDIAAIRGVALDVDPSKEIEAQPGGFDRERVRLRAMAEGWLNDTAGPSLVVNSGGGIQAVYLLSQKLPVTAENRAYFGALSRSLAALHGGDSIHDIGRPLRLPGTMNLPDDRKRKRGRKPTLARGRVVKPWRLYTRDTLTAIAPPRAHEEKEPAPAPPFDTDLAWEVAGRPEDLPADLADRLATARAGSVNIDRLLSTDPADIADRSVHDMAVAHACAEARLFDRSEAAAILTAYFPGKYEDKEEGGGRVRADKYLADTINKAFDKKALLTPIVDEDGTAGSTSGEASAGAFGDGEPLDIFNDDDPAAASTALVDTLPGPIATHVSALAARMGTPVDFAAATAVAVLAAAIGGALKLRVHEHDAGFEVAAPIAIVLIGRPGRKKSPLVKALMKPLRAIDAELHDRSAQRWAEWRAAHCSVKGAPKPGAPSPPPWQQVIVDNATVEKLIAIIADNPGGLLLDPDELMAFLGSMDAYKRNGGGDRGTLLRVFDGSAVSLERKSGSTRSKGAPTGMVATTQPDKIRAITRDLGSDGFLQRLMPVMDDGVEREGVDAPTDPHAAAEYERAVQGMFDTRRMGGGTVVLSPEARKILAATGRRIRALQALPGASAAWEGHISKWEGFLYRLALTFHALDTWAVLDSVPTGPGVPVTVETAQRASRFARALVAHALRFYGEYYEPAEHDAEAREIAGHLLAHPDKMSLTPRDIEKARRPLQGNRRLTLAAMGSLETAGWVSVDGRAADGPTKWAVNPRIHERFAKRAEREKRQRADAQRRALAAMSAQKDLNDDV